MNALLLLAIPLMCALNVALMALIDRKVQLISPTLRDMLRDPDTRRQLSKAMDLAAAGKPASITHQGKAYRVECRGAVQFVG